MNILILDKTKVIFKTKKKAKHFIIHYCVIPVISKSSGAPTCDLYTTQQ